MPGNPRSSRPFPPASSTARRPWRTRRKWDVLVVGGGVHGASIARDAASRGLTTLLVEQRDFASGTSSRSSKLAHGGLRYLEHLEVGLVRESLRERDALLRMPAEPYAYAEWRRCRAGLDYHVEVHGHFYSVPYRLIREVIEARITDQTIELFHQGNRVACHVRNPRQHRHTTIPEHMPSAHRRHAEWTPTRLMREAEAIGPSTIALVERILTTKPHPEQGFRACLGILRLVRSYGPKRLEAACQRGMDIGARTYGSVQSILRNGLDRAYHPEPAPDELPIQHENLRGSGYYH